jgi:hypothetical protein
MSTFQRLLTKLGNYPSRSGWYTKKIEELAADIRLLLKFGSAVISGGVTSGGTISASALGVTTTALDAKTNGQLKTQLAALSDVDLFTTAANVAQAVFEDGSDASGIGLATDEVAQVTLIAADTDGSGGNTGEDGALLYVAVVAGTSTTYASTSAPLSDGELRAALLASTGVHDGTTGFVRLADIEWDENGGSPQATVTVNRDA